MTFVLDQTADVSGTSLIGYFHGISRAQLIGAFGEPYKPKPPGSYKVSAEWRFRSDAGEVYTVYDWKGDEWHIGAKCDGWDDPTNRPRAAAFASWLRAKVLS